MKKKPIELIYVYCSRCCGEWVEDKKDVCENGTECPFCHTPMKLNDEYGF